MTARINLENYLRHFPETCIQENNGVIYGVWNVGNNPKIPRNHSKEYPPSYLDRVYSLITGARNVLNLFPGTTESRGITFDIDSSRNPDIVGDAEYLSRYFDADMFDLVMVNSSYMHENNGKYSFNIPASHKVLEELYKIVQSEGLVVWLCSNIPRWKKIQWILVGLIGLFVESNRTFMAVLILKCKKTA